MRDLFEGGAMSAEALDESVSSVERDTVATRDDIYESIYMNVRNGLANVDDFKASSSHA